MKQQSLSSEQSALLRYGRLSAPFRGLLQLFALCGGLSRSLLPELVRQLGIPAPRGRNWLGTDLRSAEHTLLQLKLIDTRGRCCRELEHRLALEAAPFAGELLQGARLFMREMVGPIAKYGRHGAALSRRRLSKR